MHLTVQIKSPPYPAFSLSLLIDRALTRYVGNIQLQVTDTLLQEVFQSIGPVEGCKLIRKEKVIFLS
jgi:hypothetical protein